MRFFLSVISTWFLNFNIFNTEKFLKYFLNNRFGVH